MASDVERVRDAMAAGRWWTLEDLASATSVSLVSVSSRIRDLRKPTYGSCVIERREIARKTYEYRLVPQ